MKLCRLVNRPFMINTPTLRAYCCQYAIPILKIDRDLTFTFTFGEDSMLSSAEAIIKFGPMRKIDRDTRMRIRYR